MVTTIFGVIFSPIIALVTGVLLLGVARKVMARIQWRQGPPLLQPVIDLIKLFSQTAPSHGSLFDFGLIISLAGSVVITLFLPIGKLFAAKFCRRFTVDNVPVAYRSAIGGTVRRGGG